MYKVSQDYLELLFVSIHGKNGFNNNEELNIFTSALRRFFLRKSLWNQKVKIAQCWGRMTLPCALLNWSKNRVSLKEMTVLYEVNDKDILTYITQLSLQSPYQILMLAYIVGYIVRKWERSLDCEFCFCA